MTKYTAALSLLLALTSTPWLIQAQNLNYCSETIDGTCSDLNPSLVKDTGFGLNVTHTLTGLGSLNEGVVQITAAGYGFIDMRCYNKGSEAAPGQQKATSGTGSLSANFDSSSKAALTGFTLQITSGCDCGIDSGSYTYKIKGVPYTDTCSGSDLWNATAKNGGCCALEAAIDPIDCPTSCDCRVADTFETCPNNAKNNWNQYRIGTRFDRFVIDSALYIEQNATIPGYDYLKEVQRQECFITSNNSTGSSDGNVLDAEVRCWQCELCRVTGNIDRVSACAAYPANYDPIAFGCANYTATADPGTPGPVV